MNISLRHLGGNSEPASLWGSDEIIRAEIFGSERFEQHAESLAVAQTVMARPARGHSLSRRLRDNDRTLLDAYQSIAAAIDNGRPITPAAEWLVDNYHIIEDQIREIRDDLPPGYYRQLPKLAEGPFAGYPRVFGLAWAFVAHTDSRFDPQLLCRYIRSYQRIQPLTIGELWAVAITLRIVLVENLRRAAERIVSGSRARQRADEAADRLLGIEGIAAESIATVLQPYARTPLPPAFAVQLVQRLRDQDPRVMPALLWLEERLAAQGTTTDAIVHDELQRQGASNVTVRNVITSMRLISAVDWAELFESVSLVDAALAADSDFTEMDFATRDQYRRAIEEIARGSPHSELDIARLAIETAQAIPDHATARRRRDPGYHLIGPGRRAFEAAAGYRPPLRGRLNRVRAAVGIRLYMAGIAAVAALILAIPLFALDDGGTRPAILLALGLLGLIPAVDVAVALVNRAVTNRFQPRALAGLALRGGVPAELRTMIVVPTLLTSRAGLAAQIETLEIHHLASPDGDLTFALLSDWADADAETVDGDEALLAAAAEGIAALNRRHGPAPAGDRFRLLHRRRLWNEAEGKWLGWERKRGKLHELNRLLRGATDTTFLAIGGRPPSVPADVRYVITVDADTRLPREAARRLVGKMAHPLNQPLFDSATGRIVEGHGVLQPRVTPSLPIGREGSLYQRVFSSDSGLDPYAAAVSDVYQDLFGEGSYAGKGIYDVDAFEAALAGRVPENALLSHDLFEGIFARAGLVTDIEVVEEFPARYDVAASRQHRWARGDWQLLPWLLGRPPAGSRHGAIPLIGLWKMADNLRRSLSAPASVAALLVGWTSTLGAAGLWSAFILATIALPTLLPVIAAIAPHRAGVSARSHLRALAGDLRLALCRIAFQTVFLADQAWLMADAIGRTLVRLYATRRRMLEWVPAAQAKSASRLDLLGFHRRMAGGLVLGAIGAIVAVGLGTWPVAAPFVLSWLAAPAIARWASLSPLAAGQLPVAPGEARTLRLIARRTWRFFETFVTPLDNMLPPDNFQEDPRPVVAHRTSPTNIGLYLLSTIVARDFGWLGTLDTVDRLEATLATMGRLQRFHGHLYNWYDTQDLRPLDPKYISSVDSGNLAGHLIALANACREQINRPLTAPVFLAGIADALDLAREARGDLADDRPADAITRQQLDTGLDALAALLAKAPTTDFPARLAEIEPLSTSLLALARTLAEGRGDDAGGELLAWTQAIGRAVESHSRDVALLVDRAGEMAVALERRIAALEDTARSMAEAMKFDFLFDPDRRLLSIGYLVAEGKLDPNCYDLLASEARLASFFAIAKDDVPARHWFRLGRAVTPIGRGAALISWSGSMFEYLMPSLVMRAPAGSLLEQTSRLIVRRQMDYGAELGLPWGISESAYNARDLDFTYQYSNFGIPGLGLKRGLSENVVIAPYATGLATMVDPVAAVQNFSRLAALGARGRYGFYEALDYTPRRLPEGQTVAIVRSYMAHHQAMTMVAIANALLDGIVRSRFHAEPMVQATELLLQERTPRDVAVAHPRAEEVQTAARLNDLAPITVRRLRSPHHATPRVHLLSNGHYAVMVTGAGSGYSRWGEIAVTRWREDVTADDWGAYIYLRDARSGAVWSAGYQPSGVEPDSYEVALTEDRAEFVRRDGTITTTVEIVVSPEDDAEVRRVTIANGGNRPCEIELTSYAEIVLAPPAADLAHPAFSKLFVQTEHLVESGALLATRRRRSPGDPEIWAAHLMVVEGETVGEMEVETDRARFIGRGRTLRAPAALSEGQALSGTVGTVLDPIFSLRRRVRLSPGTTARIAFWTLVAPSRSQAIDLIDKHRAATAFERAATLAWTQAQVQLRHLGIDADEAAQFQRLAGSVLYADPSLRPSSDVLRRGGGAQAGLWAQGISGDLPIILVRIDETDDLGIVRQLLQAHEYWQMKQLAVDLVILNDRASSYVQDLQVALETLVRSGPSGKAGVRGAVFVLRSDLVPLEVRALLHSVARAVLVGRRGSLVEQLNRRPEARPVAPPAPRPAVRPSTAPAPTPPALEFFNGLGGFAEDGRGYVTILGPGQWTPAPWINVVANPRFGFHVGVDGAGYSWSLNSRENQLTPWSNDPVSDRPGEIIYLRDEETGEIWGPTALPIRAPSSTYVARHGQGHSRFEHSAHGIALELLQFVPIDDPIKISRLTIRNLSGKRRRLSLTAYVEWVLGPLRGPAAFHLVTEIDDETRALLARNPWNAAFGPRVAFADLGGRQSAWTGDRREFIGRNGTLERPAALVADTPLSGRVGAGLDPCAALQAAIELAPGGTTEITFFLGDAGSTAEARSLIARYRAADLDAVLAAVTGQWDHLLGTVEVKTPDRSFDVLMNRWLLYQTLACRIWARSAFYQASGAYGFRDQLQDGMAIALADPATTRAHLLRAAARQFVEGDVQHWWLPSSGQGVRTRISDDRAWLAYAVTHYVETTGDEAVLDESIHFLEGPALSPAEHESFFQPMAGEESGSLFEHCARGLDHSLSLGSHGLPLIGTGDWNDGMNRVGEGGKGESVWLGWFLHATLTAFAPLAERRGESERAARWQAHAGMLQASLERDGWDGDWYKRGFFDDGTALGSAASSECRIDAIAQSWSVISGAGDPVHRQRAMAAVDEQLIRRADGLALLFTPPFDQTPLDPGYIKGYPPGIRENGGQYTHAALWSVFAFAALGDGDRAHGLFHLLNPINHATTAEDVQRYKVEPYSVAADIYAVDPHVGRGGWTWYTGSAGWMFRAGLEAVLGLELRPPYLLLDPCVPRDWPGFEIRLRHGATRYEIMVENPRRAGRGVSRLELDGQPLTLGPGPAGVPLLDDGATHRVRVVLG